MSETDATFLVAWAYYRRSEGSLIRVVHRQGKNGRTLCGIQIGINWGTDFAERENEYTCPRCKRRAGAEHVGGSGER